MKTFKEQLEQDKRDVRDADITMGFALIMFCGLVYGFCQAISHL